MGKTINDKLAVRLQVHCFLMKYHTFTFTMYIFAKKENHLQWHEYLYDSYFRFRNKGKYNECNTDLK